MKSFYFVDLEFPRGRGKPSGKIMEIPGGGGSNWKKPFVGGMDIFWSNINMINNNPT